MKRISVKETEPDAYKAMYELEKYTKNSNVPQKLRELIKVRASQINHCAFCIDMHTEEAILSGENERRLFALPGWKESHLFTEAEKAVLQLTEEVTLISKNGVKESTYNKVIQFYGENIFAQLLMQIIVINSWNRIAVSTKMVYK